MQHPETVRIAVPATGENPNGYVVINQSDFDHEQHVAWQDADAAEPAAETASKRKAKVA